MGTTALDYFLLVTLGCLGTIQIAAAYAGLKGLSFFKKPLAGYIFGALVAIGAFGWFFAIGNRNTPSAIEGAQQAGMFLAGAIAAYITTLAVSSLLKYRLSPQSTASRCGEQNNSGIEMLKETTLLGAIRTILKRKQEDQ
jgi:hypothetical protein